MNNTNSDIPKGIPLRRYFTVCELCMSGSMVHCPGDHTDYDGMNRVLTLLPEPEFGQGNETPIWEDSPLDQELRNAIVPIESIPPLSVGSPVIIGSIPPLSGASPVIIGSIPPLSGASPAIIGSIPPLSGASIESILRLLPPQGSQIVLPAPAPAHPAPDVTPK
jgi:hypothetical protein